MVAHEVEDELEGLVLVWLAWLLLLPLLLLGQPPELERPEQFAPLLARLPLPVTAVREGQVPLAEEAPPEVPPLGVPLLSLLRVLAVLGLLACLGLHRAVGGRPLA